MQAVDPIDEWRSNIQNYAMSKTGLQFTQQPVKHVRHAEVKQIETMYNPILQCYSNSNVEKQVRNQEKTDFIDTLAKNKDRALRYEQTYDVINFDDKLKGLENEEGYPKPKVFTKNVVGAGKTFTEYNIISNLGFNEHHFLPADKRPPPPQEIVQKDKKITTVGLRDYNIITNRYLEFHNEKEEVDKEIERMNAAKKYWKTHDFNPVNIELYDPDKEKEFLETRNEEQKNHGKDWVQKLPKSWKEEGGLFNPINGRIEDQKRLYERDLKEKNKRKRYELRYDMERNFHKRALGDEERNAQISMNKINVLRFNDTTARGFDILTNKQYNISADTGSKTIYEPNVKPAPSTWTKIKHSSNEGDDADIKFVNDNQIVNDQQLADDITSNDINDRLGDTVNDEFQK